MSRLEIGIVTLGAMMGTLTVTSWCVGARSSRFERHRLRNNRNALKFVVRDIATASLKSRCHPSSVGTFTRIAFTLTCDSAQGEHVPVRVSLAFVN